MLTFFPVLVFYMNSPSYLTTQAKWSMHMENLLILANTLRTGMSILLRSNVTGSIVSKHTSLVFFSSPSSICPIKLRSLFASCDKDWRLRIYKTAGNKLFREKLIQGVAGRWTITDHNLSLDNHWLIYSSITPHVYLTRTAADAPDAHHLLDFSTGDEDYAVRTNDRFAQLDYCASLKAEIALKG
jgi:hypothetical protein